MFRPASRALLRAPAVAVRGGRGGCCSVPKRFISTAPRPEQQQQHHQQHKRSWKSTVVRLGLAIGAVYYYNTSSVFAQEPSFSLRPQPQTESIDEASLPTLDSIKPKIREQLQQQQQKKPSTPADHDHDHATNAGSTFADSQVSEGGLTSAEDLEQEASQEAAFDPETGEINWDCPCLGGMAHGPCGEEFKAAFSCFVYSKEEPKGIECIEKFKGMQDCFRQYPDVYGSELEDDESEPAENNQPAPPAELADQTVSSDPEMVHARADEVSALTKADVVDKGEKAEEKDKAPAVKREKK